jgi:hypothetical protein
MTFARNPGDETADLIVPTHGGLDDVMHLKLTLRAGRRNDGFKGRRVPAAEGGAVSRRLSAWSGRDGSSAMLVRTTDGRA